MQALQQALADYPASVRKRFRRFHERHPEIFAAFMSMARDARGRRDRYSARTLIEVLRWHRDVMPEAQAMDLNNDFTPIYVRLLVAVDPSFEGFFHLRRVRSKDARGERQAKAAAGRGRGPVHMLRRAGGRTYCGMPKAEAKLLTASWDEFKRASFGCAKCAAVGAVMESMR